MTTQAAQPETTPATPPALADRAVVDYRTPPPAPRQRPRSERHINNARRALTHLILFAACGAFLTPFLWIVSTSLKTTDETMEAPHWIPHNFLWRNYWNLIRDPRYHFLLWTRNTLIVEVLTVTGTVISSALVAYGFSKIRFRGRGVLFTIMLSSMMIPFPVIMVSMFAIFRWLGDHTGTPWIGTFKPLWVPAWFGSAFNIFLLRQFFMTIPDELSEAARIDGCSEFGIFCRVVLPLAKPAITVVALLSFMGTWNDFLGPLIYLQRAEQFTLALGLSNLQSQHGGAEWQTLMAASVLVILPVLTLFFLAQKTFIEGIATTGLKG
jgi:multiple sugar transport system permease protein